MCTNAYEMTEMGDCKPIASYLFGQPICSKITQFCLLNLEKASRWQTERRQRAKYSDFTIIEQ